MRPRLLDLFCCAGGAAMGYHQAGFDVFGVDIRPQPDYPFDFIQADALSLEMEVLRSFDAIHASPPCQAHTQMSVRYRGKGGPTDDHLDLIPDTRRLLMASGRPYIIENVNGARHHLDGPIRLTGEMFGLGVHRPRFFEVSFLVAVPPAPPKQPNPVAVYGARMDGRRLWTRKDGSELRAPRSIEEPRAAMGIDWMDWDELKEAIPPAYTRFLGLQLMRQLRKAA